jgi:hypothetical protein
MIQLTKHELYKIFSRKGIYIVASIFIVLYFVGVSAVISGKAQIDDETYKPYFGATTIEKVEMAEKALIELENRLEIDDESKRKQRNFLNAVVNAGRSEEVKKRELDSLQSEIRQMESDGEQGYVYKQKVLEYELSKKQAPFGVYNNYAWEEIVDFFNTYGFVLLTVMLLFGLAPVFSDEYAAGMDAMILSTRHGRRKVVTAKIIASCMYIIGFALLFALLNVTMNFNAFGATGGDSPLLDISKYALTPYDFTVAEYVSYQVIMQILAAIAFGLLLIWISSVSKSVAVPIFAGGVILAAPLLLEAIISPMGQPSIVLIFSYMMMMRVENLFMYFGTVNVFGYPILYPIIALGWITVLWSVSICAIYYNFKVREVKG